MSTKSLFAAVLTLFCWACGGAPDGPATSTAQPDSGGAASSGSGSDVQGSATKLAFSCEFNQGVSQGAWTADFTCEVGDAGTFSSCTATENGAPLAGAQTLVCSCVSAAAQGVGTFPEACIRFGQTTDPTTHEQENCLMREALTDAGVDCSAFVALVTTCDGPMAFCP